MALNPAQKNLWHSAYFWLLVFLTASLIFGLFLLIAGMVTGLPRPAFPFAIAV